MATIESLQEKVAKATEKVEKCKGTIARHEKQLEKKIAALSKKGINLTDLTEEEIKGVQESYRGSEKSWDIYEVTGKFDDIKGANKKLAEAEQILGNWKNKLDQEINKEKFIADEIPQVIKDFLEEWKQIAYEWHIKRHVDFQDFKKNLNEKVAKAHVELGIPEGRMPSKHQREQLEEMALDWKSVEARKVNFAGHTVLEMDRIRNEEKRLAYLDKELEKEKKAKLLDLAARIKGAVGIITDASDLRIRSGNLNGIIIGDKDKAEVETISAGGWNIQCFHYRTLIKPVK